MYFIGITITYTASACMYQLFFSSNFPNNSQQFNKNLQFTILPAGRQVANFRKRLKTVKVLFVKFRSEFKLVAGLF
jgi:hypothetical protein